METKMTTHVVANIDGVDILASQTEFELVPIKPICESFGIDAKAQRDKLNSNPLYKSTGVLSTSVGADGKDREMYCLPFEYCLAWMLSINSANVKEEVRDSLLDKQHKIVKILKDYFFGQYQTIDQQIREAAKRKVRIKKLRDDLEKNPTTDTRVIELLELETAQAKEAKIPYAKLGKKLKDEYQYILKFE